MTVFGRGGPAEVQVTLPAELVAVRPPRRARFDPATRTVRFTLRRLRGGANRFVRARVAGTARVGTQLESIGYVSGPGDPMPLDDRDVDRGVVARRPRAVLAVASAAGPRWRGFCALP